MQVILESVSVLRDFVSGVLQAMRAMSTCAMKLDLYCHSPKLYHIGITCLLGLILMLHTRNNTDGNKFMNKLSGLVLYNSDNYTDFLTSFLTHM